MSGLVEGVRSAWDDGSVKRMHERQKLSETVMIVRPPPRSPADRLSTGKHHQDCCSPVRGTGGKKEPHCNWRVHEKSPNWFNGVVDDRHPSSTSANTDQKRNIHTIIDVRQWLASAQQAQPNGLRRPFYIRLLPIHRYEVEGPIPSLSFCVILKNQI